MYTTQNNQQSQRFEPGFYTLKAKTKIRQGLDGTPNRGLLITDGNSNQWISVPASDIVCSLNFGSKVYYHGHGSRPSLTPGHNSSGNHQYQPLTNQYQADTYSRQVEQQPQQYSQQSSSLGEAFDNGLYQTNNQLDINNQNNNYNNQPVQPSGSGDTINETLLSNQCLVLTNAIALMRELNPTLSDELICKLAISASISYQQQIKNIPF